MTLKVPLLEALEGLDEKDEIATAFEAAGLTKLKTLDQFIGEGSIYERAGLLLAALGKVAANTAFAADAKHQVNVEA